MYVKDDKITNTWRYSLFWLACNCIPCRVRQKLILTMTYSLNHNENRISYGPRNFLSIFLLCNFRPRTLFLPSLSNRVYANRTPLWVAMWLRCPETPFSSKVTNYSQIKVQENKWNLWQQKSYNIRLHKLHVIKNNFRNNFTRPVGAHSVHQLWVSNNCDVFFLDREKFSTFKKFFSSQSTQSFVISVRETQNVNAVCEIQKRRKEHNFVIRMCNNQ